MSRKPLIVGNWKMNNLLAETGALCKGIVDGLGHAGKAEAAVCPPFTALAAARAVIENSPLGLGAQDCHAAEKGAHTGDIAAAMLKDAGCRYVILGHSERRTDHNESDADVAAKVSTAWSAGLTAIVCVGETETERNTGETNDVVERQVSNSIPAGGADPDTLVVAYEPVWAIGTGRTPSVEDAAAVHRHIRAALRARFGDALADSVRILYGGSMKPDNASAFLADPDIDGGLIGGASLKAADFLAIVDAAGAD
ncbi:MAG: triose-phosphate isomerase [Rhodospirillales bacterium]